MGQEEKNKQPFPYKNQPANIILNEKEKKKKQKKNSK